MAVNRMRSWIPNALSFSNLFCGFLSLLAVSQGQLGQGAWLLFLAMFFDAMDGNVARILHNPTTLGRELDSLADVVSFVVAPSFFALSHRNPAQNPWIWLGVFSYLAAGTYRLARFNVGRPVKGYFHGLPTPAAAMFIVMTIIGIEKGGKFEPRLYGFVVPAALLFVSFLMVSRILYPKISVVGPHRWRGLFYFTLLIFPVIWLALNLESALAVLFLAYIVLGLVRFHPRRVEAELVTPSAK